MPPVEMMSRPGADDMEIARADIEARRAADGTAVGEQIGGDHAVEHGAPGLAGGLGEERLHPLAVEVDPPRAGAARRTWCGNRCRRAGGGCS